MRDDGADVRKVDTLTEALDALEDAYEMVCEVAEEEECNLFKIRYIQLKTRNNTTC